MPGSVIAFGEMELHLTSDPQRASERPSLRREFPASLVVVQPRPTTRKPSLVVWNDPR
jgi:hypothetical protein